MRRAEPFAPFVEVASEPDGAMGDAASAASLLSKSVLVTHVLPDRSRASIRGTSGLPSDGMRNGMFAPCRENLDEYLNGKNDEDRR